MGRIGLIGQIQRGLAQLYRGVQGMRDFKCLMAGQGDQRLRLLNRYAAIRSSEDRRPRFLRLPGDNDRSTKVRMNPRY
jgi:hypothetical protein